MNGVQPAQGLESEQSSGKEDDTLIDEGEGHHDHHIVIEDWSETGRGSHIDFGHADIIPIEQGRRLGRGAMGDVHEVTIKGVKLAHKTMTFRRKITERNKREIEILKRLSHVHMVQLIGTYTKQRVVGILLYPVAICDLHTFFEDVEAWTSTMSENATQDERLAALDSEHKQRLEALSYQFPFAASNSSAVPIYSKIGCLISAIAYLHEEKVRHQDLKPSNILLGPDRVWLSDFGSATDFTLLSQSATDNERGTPRYFSPEMFEFKATGRASDIFSLGCVLLEITVLHATGSLSHIRSNRSADASFHANLERISTWQTWSDKALPPWEYLLHWEIKKMLLKDPEQRPTAQNLLANVRSTETMRGDNSEHLLFGQCCKYEMMSLQEHKQRMFKTKERLEVLRKNLLERTNAAIQSNAVNAQLQDQIKSLLINMAKLESAKRDMQADFKAFENVYHGKIKQAREQIDGLEKREGDLTSELKRSEVEIREVYLMLQQSYEKSAKLSEELDKARSDPSGSARRQKAEGEAFGRILYASPIGKVERKRSDPDSTASHYRTPPSKDIENPFVPISDSRESERPRRRRSREFVPSNTERSDSIERPRRRRSREFVLSNIERSDSVERSRRRRSREFVPFNTERSDSVERPRRRRSREFVASKTEHSDSDERSRRRFSLLPPNTTLRSQGSLEGTNSLRTETKSRSSSLEVLGVSNKRTSESSGSAKRVMDLFRRIGK